MGWPWAPGVLSAVSRAVEEVVSLRSRRIRDCPIQTESDTSQALRVCIQYTANPSAHPHLIDLHISTAPPLPTIR